jgi:hypothetical protein
VLGERPEGEMTAEDLAEFEREIREVHRSPEGQTP